MATNYLGLTIPVPADGTIETGNDGITYVASSGIWQASYASSGGGGGALGPSTVGSLEITDGSVSAADLVATGVAAATYGDASNVAQITVNAKGQVVSAANVPITSGPTVVNNLVTGGATAALSAAQGVVLNAADIASGAVAGNTLTLTLKGGGTVAIDVTSLAADVKVSTIVYNGTTKALDVTMSDASTFSVPVTDLFQQAATAISPAADDAVGLVGTSSLYARSDHKHPAQAPSADTGNRITVGTDGLHYVDGLDVVYKAAAAASDANKINVYADAASVGAAPTVAAGAAYSTFEADTGMLKSYVADSSGAAWVAVSSVAGTTITNNLTTSTPGTALDAAQGVALDAADLSAASVSGQVLTLTLKGGSTVTATLPDEAIENAGALSGAAPAGAQIGVDTTTGQLYYVSAGNWSPVPVAAVDLNMTVSSQTGNNAGATPLAAPGSPDVGDVHLEIYDDALVWFSWGGAAWASSGTVPVAPNGATVVSPAADDAVGLVGTSSLYARSDHKHPAQAPSADVGNQATVGTDGLHYVAKDAGAYIVVADNAAQALTAGERYYAGANSTLNFPAASAGEAIVVAPSNDWPNGVIFVGDGTDTVANGQTIPAGPDVVTFIYEGGNWRAAVGSASPVPVPVVDNLTTAATGSALSANQGVVLNAADVASASVAGSTLTLTLKGGATVTANLTDEVVENAGSLTGAAPAGAQWGIDTTTGASYYVSGGNWAPVPVASVDLNFTVSSQAGQTSGATPLAAPASPDAGDVHLEIYDNELVWFSWNGSAWAQSGSVPTAPGAATAVPLAHGSVPAVGVSQAYAREDHVHPVQLPSADAGNKITIGGDGLHYMNDIEVVYKASAAASDADKVNFYATAAAVGAAPAVVAGSTYSTFEADSGTLKNYVADAGGTAWVQVASASGSDVFENAGALTGAVPTGKKWGVDTTTGRSYYASGGNWTASPVSGSIAIGDLSSGATVTIPGGRIEQYRSISINQTTPNRSFNLPNPSNVAISFGLDVINTGSVSFALHGREVRAGEITRAVWTGSAWTTNGHLPSGIYLGKTPMPKKFFTETMWIQTSDRINVAEIPWVFKTREHAEWGAALWLQRVANELKGFDNDTVYDQLHHFIPRYSNMFQAGNVVPGAASPTVVGNADMNPATGAVTQFGSQCFQLIVGTDGGETLWYLFFNIAMVNSTYGDTFRMIFTQSRTGTYVDVINKPISSVSAGAPRCLETNQFLTATSSMPNIMAYPITMELRF